MMDTQTLMDGYSDTERKEIFVAFLKKARALDSMSVDQLFEVCLDKFFRISKELQNDIIYCQRAMKHHIQVHQLVCQVFDRQEDADPIAKENILKDLEEELLEVNAECQYLLVHLRNDIDSFCKIFEENGFTANADAAKFYISKKKIIPLINVAEYKISPTYVLPRATDKELIHRFFVIPDVSVATGDTAHPNINKTPEETASKNNCGEDIILIEETPNEVIQISDDECETVVNNNKTNNTTKNFKSSQESLLEQETFKTEIDPVESAIFPTGIFRSACSSPPPLVPISNHNEKSEENVSQQVQISRLNLRLALRRARMGISDAESKPAQDKPDDLGHSQEPQLQLKRQEYKLNALHSQMEIKETRERPEEYGQENFLQTFGLCTPIVFDRINRRIKAMRTRQSILRTK